MFWSLNVPLHIPNKMGLGVAKPPMFQKSNSVVVFLSCVLFHVLFQIHLCSQNNRSFLFFLFQCFFVMLFFPQTLVLLSSCLYVPLAYPNDGRVAILSFNVNVQTLTKTQDNNWNKNPECRTGSSRNNTACKNQHYVVRWGQQKTKKGTNDVSFRGLGGGDRRRKTKTRKSEMRGMDRVK